MVSRANLTGRPKPGGILNRVMNPISRAAAPKIATPGDTSALLPEAESIVDPEAPLAAPVNAARSKIAPQYPATSPGVVPTAKRPGQVQTEPLRQTPPAQRGGGVGGLMRQAIEGARGQQAGVAGLAETGGTRVETNVTSPTLNKSRRSRFNRR